MHHSVPVIEGIHTSPLCFAQQNIGEKQRRGVKNNILEIFDQCQKKWNIYITSPPAVSRSIAGCFCKEIEGECPQDKGVEKII